MGLEDGRLVRSRATWSSCCTRHLRCKRGAAGEQASRLFSCSPCARVYRDGAGPAETVLSDGRWCRPLHRSACDTVTWPGKPRAARVPPESAFPEAVRSACGHGAPPRTCRRLGSSHTLGRGRWPRLAGVEPSLVLFGEGRIPRLPAESYKLTPYFLQRMKTHTSPWKQ